MRIAFAFLIADTIPHSAHWRRFIDQLPAESRIYVHAHKGIFTGSHLAEVRQVKTVKTSWEHTIAAHKQLLASAYADNCDRFILLSESCLPVQHPRHLMDYLDIDVSYFNYNPPFFFAPTAGTALRRGRTPRAEWIRPFVWYAEQWYILNRRHIEALHRDRIVYEACTYSLGYPNKRGRIQKGLWGDNEIWPLTAIYYDNMAQWASSLSHEKRRHWNRHNQFDGKQMFQHIDGVKRAKTTYTCWAQGNQHPMTYNEVGKKEIYQARQVGSVFLRKVAKNAKIRTKLLGY